MLAKTLKRIIDDKLTSAREIGELTGVAPSTVYRWIRGDSEPDFNAVRLMVRHLPDTEAAGSILSSFVAGTAWHFYNVDAELDVNKDGTIDANDALDAAINAVRTASRSLVKVREACNDGAINKDECLELIALLNDVIRHCSITQQVMVHMSDKKKKG